jgi:hypothetical protein
LFIGQPSVICRQTRHSRSASALKPAGQTSWHARDENCRRRRRCIVNKWRSRGKRRDDLVGIGRQSAAQALGQPSEIVRGQPQGQPFPDRRPRLPLIGESLHQTVRQSRRMVIQAVNPHWLELPLRRRAGNVNCPTIQPTVAARLRLRQIVPRGEQ